MRAGAGCSVLLLFMLLLSTGSLRAATTLTNRAALKFSGTRVLTAPKQNLSATGVLRSGKVLLPIEQGVDSKTLELFVRNGTNLVATPNPVTNYQGAPHLVTPANKVYIVRDQKVAEKQVLAKTQIFLSGEVALNTADQKVVRGKLYVLPESMMAWDPDDNAYAATLSGST